MFCIMLSKPLDLFCDTVSLSIYKNINKSPSAIVNKFKKTYLDLKYIAFIPGLVLLSINKSKVLKQITRKRGNI